MDICEKGSEWPEISGHAQVEKMFRSEKIAQKYKGKGIKKNVCHQKREKHFHK